MSGDIRVLIVDDVATDRELVARAVRRAFPAAQIVAVGERDAWAGPSTTARTTSF